VCVHARACVRVCVRACVCACLRVWLLALRCIAIIISKEEQKYDAVSAYDLVQV
jgi:hypothetical protein